VNVPANRTDARSIDVALIALARDHVWTGDAAPARQPRTISELPADDEAPPAVSDQPSLLQRLLLASGGFSIWSVFGVVALVPIVVIIMIFMSLRGPDDPAAHATRRDPADQAAREVNKAELSKSSAPAQTTGQNAPLAASAPAQDLVQSVAALTRQIAEARQAIDRLTAGEARMLKDNAELATRLKDTEDMVRRNAGLVDDFKAVQAQLAQDKARLEGQLQASNEQVTSIAAQLAASRDQLAAMQAQLKASQEQVAHLPEPKQHQKRAPSAPASASNAPPRPAPLSLDARSTAPKPPANPRAKSAQTGTNPSAARATVTGSR
jgi:hypothetical protein